MKQHLHYSFLAAVLCCLTLGTIPQATGQIGPYSSYFSNKNDRDTLIANGTQSCKNQMPDVLAYVVSKFSSGTGCTGAVTATITDSTDIPAVGEYLYAAKGYLTIPNIIVKDACGNFSSQRVTVVVSSSNLSHRPVLENVSIDVSCPGKLDITGKITNNGYQFNSKTGDSQPSLAYTYSTNSNSKGKLHIYYDGDRPQLKCGTSYTSRIKLKNDFGCISDTVLHFTSHGGAAPVSDYFANRNYRDTINADGNSDCKNKMPDVLEYVAGKFTPWGLSEGACPGSISAYISDSTGIPAVGEYLLKDITITGITVRDYCGISYFRSITITVKRTNKKEPKLENVSIDVSCPGKLDITGKITNNGYQFNSKTGDSQPTLAYTYSTTKGKLHIHYDGGRPQLKCGTSYTSRIKLKNDNGCTSDTVLHFTSHGGAKPVSSFFSAKGNQDVIDIGGSYLNCQVYMPDVLTYVASKFEYPSSMSGCSGKFTASFPENANIPAIGTQLYSDVTISGITVSDSCGNVSDQTITITVKVYKPDVKLTADRDVLCSGDTITLTAVATPAEATYYKSYEIARIGNSSPGNDLNVFIGQSNKQVYKYWGTGQIKYKVTFKDQCGFSNTKEFTVNTMTVPTFTAAGDTVCGNDEIGFARGFTPNETFDGTLKYTWGVKSNSGVNNFSTQSDPPHELFNSLFHYANGSEFATIVYEVTPYLFKTINGTEYSCAGKPFEYTFTVAPTLYFDYVKDTVCTNTDVVRTFTPNSTPSSTLSLAYTWRVKQVSDGISNARSNSTPAATFNTSGLVNGSSTYGTVLYEVTPYETHTIGNKELTCLGRPFYYSLTLYPAVPTFANIADTFCTPKQTLNKAFAPSTAANGTLKYIWTVKSNTGVTGADANSTPAFHFFESGLTNSGLAFATVVYEVTPLETHTSNGFSYTCVGVPFDYSVTIKPSITNAGALTYDNSDVTTTLYYGACDTLLHIAPPAFSTAIEEWRNSLTLTNSESSSSNAGALLGRVIPDTYTITWTVADPCGNYVSFDKNYIVNYPACGTGITATDGDGNVYETVRIGCECWTKSNLKTTKYSNGTAVPFANGYSSLDYPNVADNIANFGRLYSWYSAVNVTEGDDSAVPATTTDPVGGYVYVQGVCPEGWALPSMQSMRNMTDLAADMGMLKSTDQSKWLPGAAGMDALGFSAVAAGHYDSVTARYLNLLGEAYFWSHDTHTATEASCLTVAYYCDQVLYQNKSKGMGYSVRCVKRAN
jgi:uncharacterized protein (TIGR02145 family)